MRRVFFSVLLIVIALLSCLPLAAQVKLKFEKYTLSNGLKVVLHQDTSDPVVSVAILYNVGSKDEKPGKTGFAHFFEHMLFQRSENLPRNAYFKNMNALGAKFNGTTDIDDTHYTTTVPCDVLEKVLWMESDRMGFFINTVTQAGLERETDIVANEKRQAENAPYGRANELLFKYMYPNGHPYGHTVMGDIADLRSATVEDVKEFYTKYYGPSNATLVIAGDFDNKQTKQLVEKYFGEIPARPAPMRLPVQKVTFAEVKKVYYEDSYAKAPMVIFAYPGTESGNPDSYALNFLANMLAADKTSPLYKVLVEERKLMPSIGVLNRKWSLAGSVAFHGTVFPDIKLDDVCDGMQEAFRRFEKEGINERYLDRYKIIEKSRIYKTLSSTGGKALAMAFNNEFAGSPDYIVKELAGYEAVTSEDILRVYKKYIKDKNYLSVSIVPTGKAALAVTGSVAAVVEQDSVEAKDASSESGEIIDDPYEKTPSAFDRSIEPGFSTNTPELRTPQIWTNNLPGGMTVKGIVYNELPIVNFTILLNEGMLNDILGKEGVANFTARMLNEGTALKTPEELDEAIGKLGAKLEFQSGNEYMFLTGSCFKDDFVQVMTLAKEMILQPRWDEKIFDQMKRRIIDGLRQKASKPDYIANSLFRKLLFGDDNILSSDELGNAKSVESITLDDLKTFYATYFSPSTAKMSYVGSHSPAEVNKALSSLAFEWKSKDVPVPVFEAVPAMSKAKAKVFFVDYPGTTQSYIIAGKRSMPNSDPDAYKAAIVNERLGKSTSSLLFDMLRLQKGYTYDAYSNFTQANKINCFAAQSSVQASATKESVEIFREIIGGFGKGYTQQDLDNTKRTMLRKMYGSFETPEALQGMLQGIFVLNLPDDFIKQRENTLGNLSLEQAQEVIAKYMNFDDMIMIVVGDAKTQFAPLKEFGLSEVILVDKNGETQK